MKTQTEIIARIIEIEPDDFFGTETGDLMAALTFKNAEPYLVQDHGLTSEKWAEASWLISTDEAVQKTLVEYMDFAWDKANGCRGLSAGRSLTHFRAWLWLLGDLEEIEEGLEHDLMEYQFYGKDELVAICNHYGIDSAQWDDGIRSNSEY